MIEHLLADTGVSISDLKKNPSAVIEAAGGFSVAILNRNSPAAYLVPAKAWEEVLDRLAGMPECCKIKLSAAGYRLVYRVDDEVLTVIAVTVGKRERNAVYKAATGRL